MALATDLNPGSCFSGSIPLTIALACIYMGMSIEETITALTLSGAAALGMADKIGSLEAGKRGDVVILRMRQLSYHPLLCGNELCSNHNLRRQNRGEKQIENYKSIQWKN